MACKIENSNVFVTFQNDLKSIYGLLLASTIDPISFSSIGKVVFE